MDDDEETWSCEAEAIRMSPSGKAVLCRLEDGDEHWIPCSVIHDDSEVYAESGKIAGRDGTLVLPMWFATKEKLA